MNDNENENEGNKIMMNIRRMNNEWNVYGEECNEKCEWIMWMIMKIMNN